MVVRSLDSAFIDQPVVLAIEGASDLKPAADSALPEFPALTVYRQKDFSVSRQRLWGTPIPIVLCETCGEIPLPVEALPLRAPRIVVDPVTHRLRREPDDWDLRACPRCGRGARLDPQVMDCHMDSIWHPFRPCATPTSDFLFDREEMRYWMPADIIQFGRDVIPFMLDLRFLSHFLHRQGHVPFTEFCREVLAHGLIVHEGRKMSKHLGNVVIPEAMIREYGADSLRLYLLAHAEPRSDFRWSQEGIQKFKGDLCAFHDLVRRVAAGDAGENDKDARSAMPIERPIDASAGFGRYTTILLRKAAREIALMDKSAADGRYDRYAGALVRLLEALGFFLENHMARERDPRFGPVWRDLVEASVLYLAPVAPHLAEECWQMLGHTESIFASARLPVGQTAEMDELVGAPRRDGP
jgi:leucyl-tRNA synthetase